MLYAVVMAGGAGTRFWPMSRQRRPKQLLPIAGKQTMLQESVSRIGRAVRPEHTLILTNRAYAREVRRQLPKIPLRNIVGEPVARNTAPCIGVAAMMIERQDPDACVLVVTADHHVHPAQRFRRCVRLAAVQAQQGGRVVTFGIRPTYPSTGYGYIHAGEVIAEKPVRVLQGRSFVEKPSADVAQAFVDSGAYLWNSGMFVFTVREILKLYEEFLPEVYEGMARLRQMLGTRQERKALDNVFTQFPSISIDYGIMNKLTDFRVIEADFAWDDVGSWSAVERLHRKDSDGNVVLGLSELLSSRNSTVVSDEKHLVAMVGMANVIVIHTDDATLVCNKTCEQEVRQLVERLQRKGREQFL